MIGGIFKEPVDRVVSVGAFIREVHAARLAPGRLMRPDVLERSFGKCSMVLLLHILLTLGHSISNISERHRRLGNEPAHLLSRRKHRWPTNPKRKPQRRRNKQIRSPPIIPRYRPCTPIFAG